MKIGDIVEFKKTKNRYRIAGFGRMKNPGNGKWLDSVIYEQYMDYDPDEDDYSKSIGGGVFIREKEDFEDKFEYSIPKVQIYNSETGQPVYEFGVSEKLLSKYFEAGFAGSTSVHPETKKENETFENWCQSLAGDILIGGMTTADLRIEQPLLDQIRKDLEAGNFGKGVSALASIQMLIFFLTVRTQEEQQPQEPTEALDPETVDDETEEPKEEVDEQE